MPSDEERIKDQIAEAKAAIEREEADFRAKHPKDISREPVTQDEKEETIATSKETVGEPQAESLSVSNDVDTTNSHVQVPQPDPITAENQAQEEHSGEVVVENDEDTVIYVRTPFSSNPHVSGSQNFPRPGHQLSGNGFKARLLSFFQKAMLTLLQ